jgi:hypothetical protein
MSNTPKTDALFFPYGRDHTAAASPSFLTCWTEYELLEKENAAQLAELTRIAEVLGTNEGHSSVTHIEILREQLKDCSAAFDRQQEMLDRNAEQIAALRLDAERYRWLRDNWLTGGFHGVKFDTAIDAAMKEKRK